MARQNSGTQYDLAQEAARVICEERVTDYRAAKHKAAQRLGLGERAALPDNATVMQAVLEYQRIFGGAAYVEHLVRMRRCAVQAMQQLHDFHPLLVGAAVSGAVTGAHRVQLHAFDERSEALEIALQNLGIRCRQADRHYRYSNGRDCNIPLVCFEANGIGIDIAVFPPEELLRPPLNPVTGQAYLRLNMAAVQKLIDAASETR
jgi:hypothetical protein